MGDARLSRIPLSRRQILAAAVATPFAVRASARASQSAIPTVAQPVPDLAPGTHLVAPRGEHIEVEGRRYHTYLATASKTGQFYHYTCEFDASWAILKTYGIEADLPGQLNAAGHDRSLEPYAQETAEGVMIYGGDVANYFCGDYTSNFLARMRAPAMRKVFKSYGFRTTYVQNTADVKGALRKGKPIWAKVTVDFLPWINATWITPSGERYPTAYTNDHAVVVIGYNREVVVIRDVLGPTDTNWNRPIEYDVPWSYFIASMGAHGWDALSITSPG